MNRRRIWGLIVGMLLLITACDYTAGTPYHDVNSCRKDKECSERFQEWQDCTARYETGC